jgi:hypothetical protein
MEQRCPATAVVFERLLATGVVTVEQLNGTGAAVLRHVDGCVVVLEAAAPTRGLDHLTEFEEGVKAAGVEFGSGLGNSRSVNWSWVETAAAGLPAQRRDSFHALVAAARAAGATSDSLQQKCMRMKGQQQGASGAKRKAEQELSGCAEATRAARGVSRLASAPGQRSQRLASAAAAAAPHRRAPRAGLPLDFCVATPRSPERSP